LSDKDKIKELFQKELGNYQAKVNPNLWSGIQAGIGSAGAGTSLGLIGKIVIGISIATAVTVGTLLVVNNKEIINQNKTSVIDSKTEDSINKEAVVKIELKEEKLNNSPNNEINAIKKEKLNDNSFDVQQQRDIVNYEDKFKESKENIVKNVTPKENKVTPQNSEHKVVEEEGYIIKSENKKSAPQIIIPTPKEEFVSEMDFVQIEITDQKNQYVSFLAEGIPTNSYVVWDFGDGTIDRTANPEHFYGEAGVYNVLLTVKSEKEERTKNIKVEIKVMGEIDYLPNVFTPNGDGNNDEFFVNSKYIKKIQLTVIDNKQNIVFSTNVVDFRWNGFNKSGQPVKDGTYYYIIVAEDESGNTINKYQQLRIHR
jgi:gliding motility-associated-like protein